MINKKFRNLETKSYFNFNKCVFINKNIVHVRIRFYEEFLIVWIQCIYIVFIIYL